MILDILIKILAIIWVSVAILYLILRLKWWISDWMDDSIIIKKQRKEIKELKKNKMATIIPADDSKPLGQTTDLSLANMRKIVGGPIEMHSCDNEDKMWINEEGKISDPPLALNKRATAMCSQTLFPGDFICGNVLVTTVKEMNEWEISHDDSREPLIIETLDGSGPLLESQLNVFKIPFRKLNDNYIIDPADVPKDVNIDDLINFKQKQLLYKQCCAECGSNAVARLQWVNVNTEQIYGDVDSGTSLEWCMRCKSETKIIEDSEYRKHHVDMYDQNNLGGTGHGDISYSDVDPGL